MWVGEEYCGCVQREHACSRSRVLMLIHVLLGCICVIIMWWLEEWCACVGNEMCSTCCAGDKMLSAQRSKPNPSGLELQLSGLLAVSQSSQLGCRISSGTCGAKNDCHAIE